MDVSDYHVDDEELMKIITRWPKGLAPGPSGIRGEHLCVAISWGDKKSVLTDLQAFVAQSLSGTLPRSLIPFMGGGRLVPLRKKDNGVRPITIGEFFKAITEKYTLKNVQGLVRGYLFPTQIGLGSVNSGAQAGIMSVKSWLPKI